MKTLLGVLLYIIALVGLAIIFPFLWLIYIMLLGYILIK